jgi:ATP-dependent DNA helicase UvrD/PcrA
MAPRQYLPLVVRYKNSSQILTKFILTARQSTSTERYPIMETITCPKCGAAMILRNKKGTDRKFYGCSNYKYDDPKSCNGYVPFKAPAVERKIQDFSGVVGSPQQESFWDEVKNGITHLILRARAGCGKTFTITYLLSFLKAQSIAFAAFNRHIAAELQARVPDHVSAFTIHSFGYQQIRRWNPRVKLDEHKLDGILDELVPEDDNSDYIKYASIRLINLCKYNLIQGTEDELDDLVIKHTIDLNDHRSQVYTIVPQAIRISKERRNVIDFTDMLWFVYAHNIPVQTFDLFIIDELQDLNLLQQYTVLKALGDNGRCIGVGDDKQSIYGFAGAHPQSVNAFTQALNNTKRGVKVMPLTYTRRCPVSHVELAKEIVPDFESMPDAPIGSIADVSLNYALLHMQPGDMGICRRNAPLISAAYKLIASGKPVLVRGRDIGKGLQALIRKLKARDIPELIEKIESYRQRELEKLEKQGKKADAAKVALNDKLDTLIALTEGMTDLSELRAHIDQLFSDNDDKGKIILSSIHKAKGLEAFVVYIFDYARIEIPMSQEWQQLQERNAKYVALTRSKDKLYLVD